MQIQIRLLLEEQSDLGLHYFRQPVIIFRFKGIKHFKHCLKFLEKEIFLHGFPRLNIPQQIALNVLNVVVIG